METVETPVKTTKSYYIDPDLAEKLMRRAKRNHRSASAELETILEKALIKEPAA